MKVTSNLSFLLCISSVVASVVEASTKGFGRKLSAATKPTSTIKHRELFDFAAAAQQHSNRDLKSALATGLSQQRSVVTKRALKHQKASTKRALIHQKALADAADGHQHRGLQDDGLAACEAGLEFVLGPNSGCNCVDEFDSAECTSFIADNCNFCDILQGEDACISFSPVELDAAGYSVCITYESGPFDNAVCETENFIDNTCTITIDGTECSSCTVVECSDGETDYDLDCSNIIAGETWNLCTDTIPETSRFLAAGNSDRFSSPNCIGGNDGGALDFCEVLLVAQFGADSGCTCAFDGEDYFPNCFCEYQTCDVLQGQDACAVSDEEATLALAETNPDSSAQCFAYVSGPFDNTICTVSDESGCTFVIDGTECNSCTRILCDATDGAGVFDSSFDFDCSNVIAGETWNLCTANIPETSPFLALGNNNRFIAATCVPGTSGDPLLQECALSNQQLFGEDSGCTCEVVDFDYVSSCNCDIQFCETLAGQEVCVAADEEARTELELGLGSAELDAVCFKYASGRADNTYCAVDNEDGTCTLTIDGVDCNSCALITCSNGDGEGFVAESYDYDCSNIIEGETWNLCNDIPITSGFLPLGNNNLFFDPSCKSDETPNEAPTMAPSSAPGQLSLVGGFAVILCSFIML
jgi:hypothetical protein